MNLKNYLLTAFLVFISLAAYSKGDNPEDYHVRGILADGTEIEGYNETSFNNFMFPWVTEVKIADTYKGETKKYTSDELKAVWFTSVGEDSIPKIYHAVKAQKGMPNYFKKNPKPYKKPVFLRLVYNGENVKGYIRPVADYTHAQTMSVSTYTYMIYYLTKDSDGAVAYWCETGDLVPGMKKVMKFYLREFPELVEMVDKGELKPNDFRSNPAIVLPLIDKYYRPKGQE